MPQNSLVVQWLGHSAFSAVGPGSIPGWGTTIPQTMRRSQSKKKKKKTGQYKKTTRKITWSYQLMQKKYLTNISHLWLRKNNSADYALHHTYWWKTKCFPLKSDIKQGFPLLLLIFNSLLEILASTIRGENLIKMHKDWKRKYKIVPNHIWHDCLHIKSQGIYKKNPPSTNKWF